MDKFSRLRPRPWIIQADTVGGVAPHTHSYAVDLASEESVAAVSATLSTLGLEPGSKSTRFAYSPSHLPTERHTKTPDYYFGRLRAIRIRPSGWPGRGATRYR